MKLSFVCRPVRLSKKSTDTLSFRALGDTVSPPWLYNLRLLYVDYAVSLQREVVSAALRIHMFGISQGTVALFIKRVTKAIMEILWSDVVC
jgi:hypothetical protein